MPRVLVTGCRNWNCLDLARKIIGRLVARHGANDLVIVHGDCPTGVDAAFDKAAYEGIIEVERFPANWAELGKAAGPRRNAMMVATGPDFAIACHRDLLSSKGTLGCVKLCWEAEIPVWLVDAEDAEPRRIKSVEDVKR
jgi:hypothetical protein